MSDDDRVPRSVGRAFDLLESVAVAGETSLTEAATRTGLTPSTALRYLRALEVRGYLHRNADGGEALFCGNGTRCAARAAVELLGCEPNLVVETGWADIPAEVDGAQVSLEIPPPASGLQKPAIDTGWLLASTTLPSTSILTRFDAVTSS